MRKSTRMIAAAVAAALAAGASQASSHREAPNITRLPAVDATDFYLFNSYEPGREDYVTVIANYLPLQDPYGGPNYFALDQGAQYEIHLDSNGDAREDLTFQFRFRNRLGNQGDGIALDVGGESVAVPLKNVGPVAKGDNSLLNFRETYTIRMVRGDRRGGNAADVTRADDGTRVFVKPYDFVGTKTFGSVAGYEQYARSYIYDIAIPDCARRGRVFVGQRDEPFAVNLGRVFDLVNIVPVDGASFPGGITQDAANDIIADKNITTIALELPKRCLVRPGNGVVGGWTTASLRETRTANAPVGNGGAETGSGPWVQVSRLSNPLVNEVVIGLPDKDGFNASEPRHDGQFATYVTNPDAAGAARRAVPRCGQFDAGDEHPEPGAGEPAAGRPGDGVPDRLRGRQPAGESHSLGDDPPQYRDRADTGRTAEHVRRCGRRSRGIPERSPAGR